MVWGIFLGRITVLNVSDLLDDLIEQSVALVGRPVALMNKDDKVRASGRSWQGFPC